MSPKPFHNRRLLFITSDYVKLNKNEIIFIFN